MLRVFKVWSTGAPRSLRASSDGWAARPNAGEQAPREGNAHIFGRWGGELTKKGPFGVE